MAPPSPRARRSLELGLGTGVFLGAAVLLVLTTALGVALASWKASREAEDKLRSDLRKVPALFKGYEAALAEACRNHVRLLASQAETKALLAKGASGETAHAAAMEFARALGAGIVFLFDARGALLSRNDRLAGEDAGRDFSRVSWVHGPLAELAPVTAYVVDGRKRKLCIIVSAPVTQEETGGIKVNGVLAGAFPLDDERAKEIAVLTGGEVALLANLAPQDSRTAVEVVATSGEVKGPALRDSLTTNAGAVRALFRDGQPYGPFELSLDTGTWVATALPFKSGRGEPFGALVVARSKQAELAAFVRVRRRITGVGLAILLVSFPLSFLFAHHASRPIEKLAAAASAIGGGQTPPDLPRSRWREVGTLTRAFGSMVRELELRDAERKRAEEITAEWKERYEAAILASGQILYDWEPQTGAVTFGGATEPIMGLSAAEVAGDRAAWAERVHAEDRGAFRSETERVLAEGAPFHLEYRIACGDGSFISVRDEGYPVRGVAGGTARMVGFIVDITEEKRLAEHLRQSQRIEAVGRLAGGVAHDFNNLLTVIQGTAGMLMARCGEEDEAVREDVTEILRAAEKATVMTRQLLTFSRRHALQIQTVDLGAIVREMDSMLRRLIGEEIELVTLVGEGRAWVRVDRTQIEQVVMNLVVNARDAMAHGGRLSLATGEITVDEASAFEHGVSPGRYVTLSVNDTGDGMTPEVKRHIFEPFFTTKAVGKGTGLGLATVYTIVRQSDGCISVDSARGCGTTFRIYLPGVEKGPETADAEEAASAAPAARGNETVLLVEDEDGVRRLAAKFLAEHGYQVLEAASGAEALELARTRARPIHLVLTDVVMPGMSGPELAKALAALRPEIPVLFMSGHTDDSVEEHGVDVSQTGFVRKPLVLGEVVRSVRARLDRHTAP